MKKKIEEQFGDMDKFRIALGEGEERRVVMDGILAFTKDNLAAFSAGKVSIMIEPDYAYMLAPDKNCLDRWVKAWRNFSKSA
jgi:hypothetical protein